MWWVSEEGCVVEGGDLPSGTAERCAGGLKGLRRAAGVFDAGVLLVGPRLVLS